MTSVEIKEKILELFQLERQKPNADFDESHFLDYLIYPTAKTNSLKNTFKGARKYYRFMDRIELEFEICFRLSELDKYYSVDKLVEKVQERISKKKGNILILKERMGQKDFYRFELVLIAILLGCYIWVGFNWLFLTVVFLSGIAIFWTVTARLHNKRHNKKLSQKLIG
jgi:hypothetical protein